MEIHIGADGKIIAVFFADESDREVSSKFLRVTGMMGIIDRLLCDEDITEIKIVKK